MYRGIIDLPQAGLFGRSFVSGTMRELIQYIGCKKNGFRQRRQLIRKDLKKFRTYSINRKRMQGYGEMPAFYIFRLFQKNQFRKFMNSRKTILIIIKILSCPNNSGLLSSVFRLPSPNFFY
jgi:hypothetical protein